MKRPFLSRLLAISVAACTLIGTHIQARPLNAILASNKIVIGINPNLPPLGLYDEKNNIAGFDVDFANRLATELGVQLEIVPIGSTDRIPFLQADKIDAVLGAMVRTPERARAIDFTNPVHTEVLGILTTKATHYQSLKDLDDPAVRLVQVRGTTPIALIQKQAPKASLLLLDNYPDAVRAIAQGRADALVDVLDFMIGYTRTHSNTDWRLVEASIDVYYAGIGVQKGNTTLAARLNETIAKLHASGFIADTWQKWFNSPMLHDPLDSPTVQ